MSVPILKTITAFRHSQHVLGGDGCYITNVGGFSGVGFLCNSKKCCSFLTGHTWFTYNKTSLLLQNIPELILMSRRKKLK